MNSLNGSELNYFTKLRLDLADYKRILEYERAGEGDDDDSDSDDETATSASAINTSTTSDESSLSLSQEEEYLSPEQAEPIVTLDPVVLFDCIRTKGRFPWSFISKNELMAMEAPFEVLDQEISTWIQNSTEGPRKQSKKEVQEVLGGVKIKKEKGVEEEPEPVLSISSDTFPPLRGSRTQLQKASEDGRKAAIVRSVISGIGQPVSHMEKMETDEDLLNELEIPSVPKKKFKFCAWCGGLLQVTTTNDRTFGSWRWKCMTCPYSYPIKRPHRYLSYIEKDSDDEEQQIVEMAKANEHRQKTEILCPKCSHREAFFYQMQTRSADEPMTTFYECCNRTCRSNWRE